MVNEGKLLQDQLRATKWNLTTLINGVSKRGVERPEVKRLMGEALANLQAAESALKEAVEKSG
jgi:hypothetical protein